MLVQQKVAQGVTIFAPLLPHHEYKKEKMEEDEEAKAKAVRLGLAPKIPNSMSMSTILFRGLPVLLRWPSEKAASVNMNRGRSLQNFLARDSIFINPETGMCLSRTTTSATIRISPLFMDLCWSVRAKGTEPWMADC